MYELTEIYNGEVMLHSMLTHNEAICAAVERSRDYIMITNKNHMIRVSRVFIIKKEILAHWTPLEDQLFV